MAMLNVTPEEINQAREELYKDNPDPWDPVSKIKLETIKDHIAELTATRNKLKANPRLPRKHRNRKLRYFYGSILIGALITYFTYDKAIAAAVDVEGVPIMYGIFGFLIILFSSVPYIVVKVKYQNIAIDFIKVSISLDRNWIYDPAPDEEKLKLLKKKFPEIFSIGSHESLMDKAMYIDNQVWGNTENNDQIYDFYSGEVFFQGVPGSDHFFCLKLNKNLKTRFNLYPEFTKLSQDPDKEINTESIEFNRHFAFDYKGTKGEKSLDIVTVLSPAVQQKLTKLRKSKGKFYILFAEDCAVFLFSRMILYNPKTRLFKSIEVHDEDKSVFDEYLNEIIDISTEMAKYLD